MHVFFFLCVFSCFLVCFLTRFAYEFASPSCFDTWLVYIRRLVSHGPCLTLKETSVKYMRTCTTINTWLSVILPLMYELVSFNPWYINGKYVHSPREAWPMHVPATITWREGWQPSCQWPRSQELFRVGQVMPCAMYIVCLLLVVFIFFLAYYLCSYLVCYAYYFCLLLFFFLIRY